VQQHLLDLQPGPQVVGEVVVGDQPGQVDDPADAVLLGRRGHLLGRLPVLADEVALTHGVHEVDHGVHALERLDDGGLVLDVERHRRHVVGPGERRHPLRRAGGGVDLTPLVEQDGDEARADVAGRARHEDAHEVVSLSVAGSARRTRTCACLATGVARRAGLGHQPSQATGPGPVGPGVTPQHPTRCEA
jgi:hypothetical protein